MILLTGGMGIPACLAGWSCGVWSRGGESGPGGVWSWGGVGKGGLRGGLREMGKGVKGDPPFLF